MQVNNPESAPPRLQVLESPESASAIATLESTAVAPSVTVGVVEVAVYTGVISLTSATVIVRVVAPFVSSAVPSAINTVTTYTLFVSASAGLS